MEIESKDYKGNCRRNGGKLNLSLKDWAWIVSTAVTLLVVGTIAWTNLSADVSRLEQAPLKIAQLETKVEAIQEDIQEIKIEQKKGHELLYKIWGKVNGD